MGQVVCTGQVSNFTAKDMVKISAETLASLHKDIGANRRVPEFYLAVLDRGQIEKLLRYAAEHGNTVFELQLAAYLAMASSPQPSAAKPSSSLERQFSYQVGKLAVKGRNTASKRPSRKRGKKRLKSRRQPIQEWPPPCVLGRDTSAAAVHPTVFASPGNGPIVYIGGDCALPIQNDKSGNSPSQL